jgi:flagellin-like protein
MQFLKDEEAVSPVIGVILMVAITVILAAVIAAFVFGMSGSVQKTKNVGVTVKQIDDDTVEVTEQGGANFNEVSLISIDCDTTTTGFEATDATPAIGNVVSCDGVTTGQDHIIVVATFDDGSEQVVLDTYV